MRAAVQILLANMQILQVLHGIDLPLAGPSTSNQVAELKAYDQR